MQVLFVTCALGEVTNYQQHNLNIFKPLVFLVFVCVQYMHFLQQSVSVSIKYLLIITCNVLTPAASTQLCPTVPPLNKIKSVAVD